MKVVIWSGTPTDAEGVTEENCTALVDPLTRQLDVVDENENVVAIYQAGTWFKAELFA